MPGFYANLRIAGDPTNWRLSQAIGPEDLTQPDNAPFRATVIAPRAGTLLLSSRAAASVVLSGVGGGATPNGGPMVPEAFLYLPSVTGLTAKAPANMYPLPAGTDLTALEGEITTAMSQGQPCTVQLDESVIVLNGATLPFAVFFGSAGG
jgi:hypothetical protein